MFIKIAGECTPRKRTPDPFAVHGANQKKAPNHLQIPHLYSRLGTYIFMYYSRFFQRIQDYNTDPSPFPKHNGKNSSPTGESIATNMLMSTNRLTNNITITIVRIFIFYYDMYLEIHICKEVNMECYVDNFLTRRTDARHAIIQSPTENLIEVK